MKFKHVGEGEGVIPCYGGTTHEAGGTVEIPEAFAEKAKTNPDYERVKPGPKKEEKAE